jgi:hypothetical protein
VARNVRQQQEVVASRLLPRAREQAEKAGPELLQRFERAARYLELASTELAELAEEFAAVGIQCK